MGLDREVDGPMTKKGRVSGSTDRYIYRHNVSCKTNKSDCPSTTLNQPTFLFCWVFYFSSLLHPSFKSCCGLLPGVIDARGFVVLDGGI